MAHSRAHSLRTRAFGRKKFDLNLRAYRQICNHKQAHTDVANVDPKCFNRARFGKYTDGGVEQLTFLSAPVLLEIASEKHWQKHEDKVAPGGGRAEITKGSVFARSRTYDQRLEIQHSVSHLRNAQRKTVEIPITTE